MEAEAEVEAAEAAEVEVDVTLDEKVMAPAPSRTDPHHSPRTTQSSPES